MEYGQRLKGGCMCPFLIFKQKMIMKLKGSTWILWPINIYISLIAHCQWASTTWNCELVLACVPNMLLSA
jgi:hypothetical protein